MNTRSNNNNALKVYTDGACKDNPGVGGWGVLIQQAGMNDIELYGGVKETTSNRMELKAAIEALTRLIPMLVGDLTADVITDSKYVKNGITKWINSWRLNGWKTSARTPVKNADLWKQLDDLMSQVNHGGFSRVNWAWTKGHSGNPGNERADALANLGTEGKESIEDGLIQEPPADVASKAVTTGSNKPVQMQLPLMKPVSFSEFLSLLASHTEFDGMTLKRLQVLDAVANYPGINKKTLGEMLDVSRTAIFRHCNALSEGGHKHNGRIVDGKGWIEIKKSTKESRKHEHHLTKEGESIVKKLWGTV